MSARQAGELHALTVVRQSRLRIRKTTELVLRDIPPLLQLQKQVFLFLLDSEVLRDFLFRTSKRCFIPLGGLWLIHASSEAYAETGAIG